MKYLLTIVFAFASVAAQATQYSKLALITAAKNSGKWDAVKTWISSAGLQDEFQSCAYLSDEYPQFASITNAVVTNGVATAEEIKSILNAAKDQAVSDTLIRKVYDTDMASDTGRSRWHGKPVEVRFDTNRLVKVQIYADGFVYEQPFRSATASSIESKITAAELREKREEERKKSEARAEAKRLARIAYLETNMTAEVSIIMSKNVWPEDLARLYLQTELNKLKGTNVVGAVVTPQ